MTRFLIELKPKSGTWQKDIDRVMAGGDQTIAGVYPLKPATEYNFR